MHTDPDLDELDEVLHPLAYVMKKCDEDTPQPCYHEAMRGLYRDSFILVDAMNNEIVVRDSSNLSW